MTTTPAPHDSDDDLSASPASPDAAAPLTTGGSSPDPITGEPDAHPVGVGVGAISAGMAGAAIGALAGPVGVVIGAAIGAIAGGLAGKEVAESPEISPTANDGVPLDSFDHSTAEEEPLSASLANRVTPHEDAFFTGGTLSGKDPDQVESALDDFDRPRPVSPYYADLTDDDKPLPTASSGLVTPDESSFFADSTTGESSVLTESPFPAAHAVSPGDRFADMSVSSTELPTDSTHVDTEHTVRTNAYYRYLDREANSQPGSDFEDWIEAEKEVLSR